MSLKELLEKHSACTEAREWAEQFETLDQAWAVCERGDWMLWLAAKAKLCKLQEIILATCQCARLALPYTKRPEGLTAIETAEAWARGEASLKDVKKAAYAAAAAAYAADAAAYAAAYAAAADAADAAVYAAADAAAAAAYAADAAAYAAYAAAAADANAAANAAADAADARKSTLAKCADLVRNLYKGGLNENV